MRAILPIEGVPEQFIRAVNDRLRELESLIPAASDAASAALPSVGTPGRYTKVTTDAQGRVIAGGQLQTSDLPGGGYPVGSDAQIAYNSGSLNIITAGVTADVPGTTLTLARAGRYHITGVFDFTMSSGDATALATLIGTLCVNGSEQTGAYAIYAGGTARVSASQSWLYTAASAGLVAKLQARKSFGAGTSTCGAGTPACSITAVWIGP